MELRKTRPLDIAIFAVLNAFASGVVVHLQSPQLTPARRDAPVSLMNWVTLGYLGTGSTGLIERGVKARRRELTLADQDGVSGPLPNHPAGAPIRSILERIGG